MTHPNPNLTPKQERFCQEYLIDLNATQAAIRAGYSEHTAGQIGDENLKKPEIQKHLQTLMQERSQRTQITADNVLKELASIAFTDMREFGEWDQEGRLSLLPSSKLTSEQTRAVRTVKFKRTKRQGGVEEETMEFALHDKLSALEKLGKHLGLFVDRVEHSGPEGGVIPIAAAVATANLRPEDVEGKSVDELARMFFKGKSE